MDRCRSYKLNVISGREVNIMLRSGFGLTEDDIDAILIKEGIDDNKIKDAIKTVIRANNDKIAHYLESEYIRYINKELGRMMKQNLSASGIRY